MRTPGLLITLAVLAVIVVPLPAEAFQFSGGVSFGGFQVGTVPRLAISPHLGASWQTKSDFVLALHDQCSFLPPTDTIGIGVYNQASISIGYSSKTAIFSAGPSFAIYSMTTCGQTLCGRVVGVALGGHAQADVYVAGPLGVSVSANADWVGGSSLVIPSGVAVMVLAGPVLRWSDQ
jgi:hypothetical protein